MVFILWEFVSFGDQSLEEEQKKKRSNPQQEQELVPILKCLVTFKCLLIHDKAVVSTCLCQTEEPTPETGNK